MITLDWKRCVVLALVAVSGVGLLASCGTPQPPAVVASSRAIAVDVAPATKGTITVTTIHAAVVEAKDRVDVIPLATGRIEKLTVDIGSKVQKGQLIAELSHGTLDAQLQGAEATLRNARANLASVQTAVKPGQIHARVELDAAGAKLDQLLNPSASDLSLVVSAVATARSTLDSAKTELEQLLRPSPAELADAQASVADAQSELSHARTKVDQAISMETSAVGLVEFDVDSNPVLLEAALANLNLLKNPSPADFAAVEAAVAFEKKTLAGKPVLSGRQTTETVARVWGVLLIARQGLEANTATLRNLTLSTALTPDELATVQRIMSTNQEIISTFMAIINSGYLIPESIRNAMWIESKEIAASARARAALEELQNPSQNNIALAKNEVDGAQASLDAALAKLNVLKDPNPADLAAAKASVAVAEQTLTLSQGAHIQQALEASQAQVDHAQSQVNLVKQQLAELQIRAPFDGFVTQLWLSAGAVALTQVSTPIVTVVSKDVVVSWSVEETDISYLRKGQRVTFTSSALPGQYFELEIDRIAPAGQGKSGAFEVQMRPLDPDTDLKPGMSGQGSISISHENAVLVPKDAVLRQGGQSALLVVQDGQAHFRQVSVGLMDDKNVEILGGVKPGDQVVVSGHGLLSEATPVSVVVN